MADTEDGAGVDAVAAELFAELATDHLGHAGVDWGKVWHNDGLTVNGKVFAMLVRERLVVKVPARQAADLARAGIGEPFEPRPGRPLKEWVEIPFTDDAAATWRPVLADAYGYVATLTGVTRQPRPIADDPADMAHLIADAFGLGRPTGPLAVNPHSSQETWRLPTRDRTFLIKRFWRGRDLPWEPSLTAAMAFEATAIAAGIETPQPIRPVQPAFGFAASIDGLGVFRAYPYLDHRPLAAADDVVEWAAGTLARVQNLEPPLRKVPEPTWFYDQFPVVPAHQWDAWSEQAAGQGRTWAPALERLLPAIHLLATRVTSAFAGAAPHVMTHRDVEPWNVLMVPTATQGGHRPVLIDWDVAGPDSASLEAAHVLTSFAGFERETLNPGTVRRGVDAYVAAGGTPFDPASDLLARRLGMRLARMSGRIRATLTGFVKDRVGAPTESDDDAIAGYLDVLVAFIATAERDARML